MRKQNLVQIGVVGVFTAGLLIISTQVRADDNSQLKDQVQALQDRVNQLEAQLANNQQAAVPTAMPAYVDPYTQMMLMRQQMERNMRQAQAAADTGVFSPRMDMKQTDKQYVVTMDIPGMDKDKIDVEIKENMLIISGERRGEGISFGSFMQAIPLPEDALRSQIEAKYNNGVLTVTVPRVKKEEKKPQEQKIMVK